MIKANIHTLIALLSDARDKGARQVKLQLYENWYDINKEQKSPSMPAEEYKVDTRFYNTLEFDTVVKNMEATDRLIVKTEDDLLIFRVSLSDKETLLRNIGIPEKDKH